MNYSDYSVTDLVMDEGFQQWVKDPNAASQAHWENWLTTHPEKREVVEEARLLILSIDFRKTPPTQINKGLLWQNIQAKLREPLLEENAESTIRLAWNSIFYHWRKVTAVLAGLAVLGSVAYYLILLGKVVTYTTSYGANRVITLPDGSVVTLNANSSLKYNTEWKTNKIREVWLEGEAFFSVVKEPVVDSRQVLPPSSRFVVHAHDLNIEVLGTEFDVNNRHGITRVVLKSGKVSLRRNHLDGDADVVMQPADLVDYSEANRQLTKRRVNPEQYASWVNKKLMFHETPLSEIARIMEDTYGLTVVFGNEQLASRKFTGSADTNDLDLLLTAISESFNVKITRNANQILINNQ